MKIKFLCLSLTVMLTAGCAGTQSPSNLTQLQIKVNQMERKLDERQREIEELKFTVNNLTSQIDDSNDVSFNDPIQDIDLSGSKTTNQKLGTSAFKADGSIIRVSESPQQIQTALKKAGYYQGNIDGKIGSGSQQAILDFQRDHNLKADGIVGKSTWSELKNYLE